jgi:intracellular multiplication protein IcmX
MKKSLLATLLSLVFLSNVVIADNLTLQPESNSTGPAPGNGGQGIQKLVEYLKNLGAYLGYDLTKKPEENSTQLINLEEREGSLVNLINSWFGATPVNGAESSKSGPYVPTNVKLKINPAINDLANSTFKIPTTYNSPTEGKITVNAALDQKTYQLDPVSQSIFNILTTPDASYCMDDTGEWLPVKGNSGKSDNSDCNYLYQGQVVNNVIGELPIDFFSHEYNQPLVAQLNANSLIAPLMYSYEQAQNSTNNSKENPGMQAANQAQEAANFVRYAIADVLPIPLANKKRYLELLRKAKNAYKDTSLADQKNAQNVLDSYLAGLRVYTAQRSVAIGNLYGILSRRIPQASQSETDTAPISEALSEFTMSAWRLKDISDQSGKTPNKKWLQQINKASSATVQKEIAVLLAELNYQMYLSRQQQERLLLTETMNLLQNMKEKTPSLIKSTVEAESLRGSNTAPVK